MTGTAPSDARSTWCSLGNNFVVPHESQDSSHLGRRETRRPANSQARTPAKAELKSAARLRPSAEAEGQGAPAEGRARGAACRDASAAAPRRVASRHHASRTRKREPEYRGCAGPRGDALTEAEHRARLGEMR